ncbi:type II toxin-antitoxin system RelE/ParE family toxin [Aliidiomarina celeris]|uniref:type II toxin-antitoxin system RelE/ParE family toxin n=1 Tax=Aliidiomarina celeris TaxID=2249428 RepID=UPI000DEA0DD1
MPNYFLTSAARADLVSIRRYTIDRWGISQARKYLTSIKDKMEFICSNPLLGTPRPEVDKETLSFPCNSHIIYYKCLVAEIYIIAVLHKSSVPSHHLHDRSVPTPGSLGEYSRPYSQAVVE